MRVDHAQFDDLLQMPFRRNGRFGSGAIDCLGITLEMARRRGRWLADPWDRVHDLHAAGQAVDHLFSPGWHLAGRPVLDDDVVLMNGAELGAGYVYGGHVYSGSESHGVYRVPLQRVMVHQNWRFAP